MAALVLLRQELHGIVNAFQFPSRDHEVPWLLRASSQQHGIELSLQILHRHGFSYVRVGDELHPFALHLFHTAVDEVFFHLEFWNAVTQQTSDAVGFFVDRDPMAGAIELLRGCQARRDQSR